MRRTPTSYRRDAVTYVHLLAGHIQDDRELSTAMSAVKTIGVRNEWIAWAVHDGAAGCWVCLLAPEVWDRITSGYTPVPSDDDHEALAEAIAWLNRVMSDPPRRMLT